MTMATGFARSTINRGEDDLDAEPLAKGKIRRSGGGRWAVAETDPKSAAGDLVYLTTKARRLRR